LRICTLTVRTLSATGATTLLSAELQSGASSWQASRKCDGPTVVKLASTTPPSSGPADRMASARKGLPWRCHPTSYQHVLPGLLCPNACCLQDSSTRWAMCPLSSAMHQLTVLKQPSRNSSMYISRQHSLDVARMILRLSLRTSTQKLVHCAIQATGAQVQQTRIWTSSSLSAGGDGSV